MAKMFYSMEEVQEKLNCTEDKIKEFVKEGMLREFRDGMKILFKVDEVDTLAGSSSDAGDGAVSEPAIDESSLEDIPLDLDESAIGLAGSSIGLAPSDTSSDSIGLADSVTEDDNPLAGGGDDDLLAGAEGLDLDGSSIGLASSGSGYGLADSNTEGGDDAYDMSNSDSVGLADAVSMEEDSQLSNDKDDTVVTSHGIDALEDTEMDMDVDPLAQTKISSPFADEDEISIDPSSSGSGLLDLSREADDTSLGADILKDIYSDDGIGDDGEEAPMLQSAVEDSEDDTDSEASGLGFDEPVINEAPVAVAAGAAMVARRPQLYDPTSGAFGVMLIIPFVMLIYMLVNVCAFTSGTTPSALSGINNNLLYVVIGTGVLALLVGLYGFVLAGNTSSKPAKPKREKAERKPKAKKAKKEKKPKAKKVKKKK